MTTSGVNNFIVTRDQIIQEALEITGVYDPSVTTPAVDISSCSMSLNIMCKALAMEGLPLWAVQEITIPMIANQASYQIGPASSQNRPLRILDAFIRDSSGNDTSLKIISRYDYDTQGAKASQSTPNQLWYDPQLTNGIVTVYGVPIDATNTIHIVIQRQFQDFNSSTDNPDFTQEAYLMLVYGLADMIGLKYRVTADIRQEIALKFKMYKDQFFGYQQEQVPITLVPGESYTLNAVSSNLT